MDRPPPPQDIRTKLKFAEKTANYILDQLCTIQYMKLYQVNVSIFTQTDLEPHQMNMQIYASLKNRFSTGNISEVEEFVYLVQEETGLTLIERLGDKGPESEDWNSERRVSYYLAPR